MNLTDLTLRPIDDDIPDDAPDLDTGGCRCTESDGKCQLEIDAGSVIVTHLACGKQLQGDWWVDALQLDPIPVQVKVESHCDGSEWHGDHRCDCDYWAQITIDGLPGGAA